MTTQVTKVRVTPGEMRIPFLGIWEFIPVTINDGEAFDTEHDLVAGQITVGDKVADAWDGDRVLLDRSGWLLRPGDLVQVDMPNGDTAPGYYVPIKAIRHESGRAFVFVAQESNPDEYRARQVEVKLTDSVYSRGTDNVLRRIETSGEATLADGMRLIVEGVHTLRDGEAIAIVDRAEHAR